MSAGDNFDRSIELGHCRYTYEALGITQFHEVCMSGCLGAVERFLELGQDPNCREQIAAGAVVDPPLHMTLRQLSNRELVRTLLRAGADPNLANHDGRTALHVVCQRHNLAFEMAELLFETCDEEACRQVRVRAVDARDKSGWTPLQLALSVKDWRLAELLLSRGANPTLADPRGRTSLQLVCEAYLADEGSATIEALSRLEELARSMLSNPKLTNEKGQTALHLVAEEDHTRATIEFWCNKVLAGIDRRDDPEWIDARDEWGNAPLHLACDAATNHSCHQLGTRMIEWLLEAGADPNPIDCDGVTPLHIVAVSEHALGPDWNAILAELLFDLCERTGGQRLLVDAQDDHGATALHLAVQRGNRALTRLLLRRGGADPNLAKAEGSTALHLLGLRGFGADPISEFFAVCDELGWRVQVDARDHRSNTPLHLALGNDHKLVAEVLLRRGADPNSANAEGSTPLHVICGRHELNGTSRSNLVSALFRINDESGRHRIPIDARDNRGRTPLQRAATSLAPDNFEVLLDRGVADLASFVFPTEAQFDEHIGHLVNECIEFKLILAIGAMTLIECLEKRGYELERGDAMAIMRVIDKLGVLRLRVNDPTFASMLDKDIDVAKNTMVKDDDGSDSTTLHDLMRMQPGEAARRFSRWDCYEFERSAKLWRLDREPRLACHSLLFEITSRRFFKSWALDPFMQLTHCRLPILCADMICDNLNNEDLFNICLAVEGQGRASDAERND